MEETIIKMFLTLIIGASVIYLSNDGNFIVFIIWWVAAWYAYNSYFTYILLK